MTADRPPTTGTPARELPPPPNTLALLRQAGLHAKKSWGQNFLLDQSVLADIARLAVAAPGDLVVELGAGLGALTYHLLARGARLCAVERDRDIAPLLRQSFAWASDLEVLEADAGRLDYTSLAARLGGAELSVCGNLPYQLSGRILVALADAGAVVRRGVLLVQREVGERLVAAPGSRTYGLLSVLVQRRFAVRLERHVPPGAFHPVPKVHSAVVSLSALAVERALDADRALVRTAKAAFHSRRKTLRNSLAMGLAQPPAALDAAFGTAGISPQARAEVLSVRDFERLAAALVAHGLIKLDAPGEAADADADPA
jgi:16S rRNA (adenine1518-N6/adenine1519-N6)-dimethyltransferase